MIGIDSLCFYSDQSSSVIDLVDWQMSSTEYLPAGKNDFYLSKLSSDGEGAGDGSGIGSTTGVLILLIYSSAL